MLDVPGDLVEGLLVDHRVDEVGEVLWVAHGEAVHVRDQFLLHLRPQVVRYIGPAGGAALLSLELEGPPAQGGGHLQGVGAVMRDHEVLAAGLAHDAGIAAVHRQVVGDGLPQLAEHARAAGEVEAGELRMAEDHVACRAPRHMHQVDDPVRQAGLMEEFHDHLGAVHLALRRFPHGHVAHQGGRAGQVAGDAGEVEGREREHEAFQRPVLDPVPGGLRTVHGLVAVDLRHVLHVEAQEVRELAGRVDLRLENVLALGQHGGRVHPRPVRSAEQVGRLQEDRRTVLPGHGLPGRLRRQRGINGPLHMVGRAEVGMADGVLVIVRRRYRAPVVRRHAFGADPHGQVLLLLQEAFQFVDDLLPLRGAGRVAQHGFVGGVGGREDGVDHGVHCEGPQRYPPLPSGQVIALTLPWPPEKPLS